MDYIGNNKAAWEEAFDHKQDGWGEENYKRLLNEDLPFRTAGLSRAIFWILMRSITTALILFCLQSERLHGLRI